MVLFVGEGLEGKPRVLGLRELDKGQGFGVGEHEAGD